MKMIIMKMNNERIMKSRLLESLNIPFHYSNQIHSKDQKTTKKVSGPNLLNNDYIHYSDIKIR